MDTYIVYVQTQHVKLRQLGIHIHVQLHRTTSPMTQEVASDKHTLIVTKAICMQARALYI